MFKKIIVLLSVITLLLLIFVGYQGIVFRVTGTSPSINNVAAASPYLIIHFNKSLDASSLKYSTNTSFITSATVMNNSITFNLSYPLSVNKTYSLTILTISSQGGSKLTNITYRFVPKNLQFNQLDPSQQKQLINNQDRSQTGTNDPILIHLPYSTLDFTLMPLITSQDTSSKISLQASLLLSAADVGNEDAAIAQYKQEVINYIESLGLNPSNYNISYVVVQPTM